MNLRLTAVLVAGTALLGGCTNPSPLVISDLQTDKVVIQADRDEDNAAVLGKAREGCAVHGRTPLAISTLQKCSHTVCSSPFWSTYCNPTNCWIEHLFACVRQNE